MSNCPKCGTNEAYFGFSTIECTNPKCHHFVQGNVATEDPNDEPAYIGADGTKEWYKSGKRHRDGDEPAIIRPDGTKEWRKDRKLHRDGDEPAVIRADGTKEWYKDGIRHRDGDEPAVIRANGTKKWWKDGKYIQ